MMEAISVRGISKKYGKVEALRGIDFTVNHGELFGIIGPDGAGKTSLFRILTTLLTPDTGSAIIDGYDIIADYKAIRCRVGYMPGRFSLYQDLSVEENLSFYASVFGTTIEANYSLINPIYKQIEPFKMRRAGKLSGGMKQKLALCCALIHKPSVLFLDEPTTGVDPVSRQEFWDMLDNLKRQQITILVSTPYMDEANRCDRIALIRQGEFMQIDTPANIIGRYDSELWSASSDDMYSLLLDIRDFAGVTSCYTFGVEHHFTAPASIIPALIANLQAKGHTRLTVGRAMATIEDCYMQLDNKYHG